MYFVGVITDDKSKKYISKIIKEQIKTKKFQIIFITEKNAENMKNIRFDTIAINKKLECVESLQNNLINTKYIIINSDLNLNLDLLKETNFRVINYGFNSKATITPSSNTEDSVQICVQRNIFNKKENIEQQEISLAKNQNTDIYDIMLLFSVLLIYDKDVISLLKL